MNVFLSADIEGTCGITDWAETERSTPYDYNYFKKQMTFEVKAACGGPWPPGRRGSSSGTPTTRPGTSTPPSCPRRPG